MNHFETQPANERLEKVLRDVENLDIGLDLRQHPELCARLSEIGHHFDDSLHMARIIRAVYEPLREALGLEDEGPERLMRAAVLHDIGKSGPAGEEGDFNRVVQKLFVPPEQPFNPYDHGRARTITEFVDSQDWPEDTEILEVLKATGVNPDEMPMIDFWRRHVQWTYDILKLEVDAKVDSKVVLAAASHHMYEHRDPAALHPETATELSQDLKMAGVLEIIDKYQANRVRWARNHEDSIAWLEQSLERQPDLPPALAENFRTITNVLRNAKDIPQS